MPDLPKPTREQFQKFWQQCEHDDRPWPGLRPHLIYLGTLTLYSVVVSYSVDFMWLPCIPLPFVGFFILVIAMPWTWDRRWRQWAARHSLFRCCSLCGCFFGHEYNESNWERHNPKWKHVAQSGTCPKCGQQIIAESP